MRTLWHAFLPLGLLIVAVSTGGERVQVQALEKKTLALASAKAMAAVAESEAMKRSLAVSIAIADESGNLLYFLRMDEALLASIELAQRKAHTAASFNLSTGALGEYVLKGGFDALTLPDAVALRGGLPIQLNGRLVGAIAVSGAPSGAEDESIAQVAIDTLKR